MIIDYPDWDQTERTRDPAKENTKPVLQCFEPVTRSLCLSSKCTPELIPTRLFNLIYYNLQLSNLVIH